MSIVIVADEQELADNELCDLLLEQLNQQILFFKRFGAADVSSRWLGTAPDYHTFRVHWRNHDFTRTLGKFNTEMNRRLNSHLKNDPPTPTA